MRRDPEQLRTETTHALNQHATHYYGTHPDGTPRTTRMTNQEILQQIGQH